MTEARDFPFYRGAPVRISLAGWLCVLLGSAAGFTALVLLPAIAPGPLGRWLSIGLFVGLPLLGLAVAAGRHWTAIFHRPTKRDIWIGLAFAPLTLLVSATAALIVMHGSLTAANPVIGLMKGLHGLDLIAFLASTAPQLLGEELVTLLPFLAVLAILTRLRAPPWLALAVAWIATALMFGALHLPTYQWHVAQALLIIGAARMALTASYVLTKNVWASFIAHITHDWSLFAIVIVASKFVG